MKKNFHHQGWKLALSSQRAEGRGQRAGGSSQGQVKSFPYFTLLLKNPLTKRLF
jgi:hypothetical protein